MKKLKSLKVWTHCTNEVKTLKAPALGLGRKKPVSYVQAKKNAEKKISGSPYYGMVFDDKTSDYIGIDVDVDPEGKKKNATREIPAPLLFFLAKHPTHIHYSPSGHGIHIIYKLHKKTQETLNRHNLKQKATKEGDLFSGDWRYRKSFLVFTENLHELSTDKISYITIDDLKILIPSLLPSGSDKPESDKKKDKEAEESIAKSLNVTKVPTLENLREILTVIPSTFNRAAKIACTALPYAKPESNYDYWVLIGCACAHHAILLDLSGKTQESKQVVNVFTEWSSKDKEGFTGNEDVLEKFSLLLKSTKQKLKDNEHITTISTLALIAKGCTIDFPDMIVVGKKGKTKLRPDPGSIKNLEYLMKYEDLELVFDPMGGGVCFYGPEETITQWFCPQKDYLAMRPKNYSQVATISDMAIRFKPYMQNRYKYSVTSTHARDAIDFLCQSMRRENAFKSWILSSKWDGVNRFKELCKSINIPDDELENKEVYETYIRKSFLSMIGIHFWPDDSPKIPAMLVLTGPEYTYKSSWSEWLIPKHMGNYIATAEVETALTGGKEWHMFLSTKAVVVINECEPLFSPKHEQKVKSNVDSETVTYRDPYAKHVLTRPRTALIIGTTNKAHLFTGSTGTRKIWQIPVKECDSMLVKRMDLQQLYAEIYHRLKEFKKKHPDKLIQEAWEQTKEDRRVTNMLNARRKGEDLGILGLLCERFGHFLERKFKPEEYVKRKGVSVRPGKPGNIDNEPNAWTVTAMMKFLKFDYPDDRIDRISVKYALEEYSAAYTKTIHHPKELFKNIVSVEAYSKIVKRGRVAMTKDAKYYLMPTPLKFNTGDEVED